MVRPKKSLGQNWLRSESALRAIIEAGELSPSDTVLEIGPGEGVLTAALLERAGRVIAVEKDERLVAFLNEKFAESIRNKQLEILNEDILDWKIENLLESGKWKLIANIPYYLTGQIFRKFLETENQPILAVLLVQKEVAERIVGLPRAKSRGAKESLLSISVKAFGEPKIIKTVPAGAFHPRPKVDSAILKIANISRARLGDLETSAFFTLLRQGFAHPRKLLAGNLSCSTESLATCKINPKARAENLSLEQWLCLQKILSQN
jgi:16S rRNA (adenine1518-N6/adenine1519-N6)-dimethyltransferase